MQIRKVDAFEGVRWMRSGFRCFLMQPLSVGALLFMSLTFIGLLGAIPLLGQPLRYAALPFVFVGMQQVSRTILRGAPAWPHVLLEPLRATPGAMQRMAGLSLLYVAILSIGFFLATFDNKGELFAPFSEGVMQGNPSEQDKAILVAGMNRVLTFCAFIAAAFLSLWFAPPLIAWHGYSVGKAVFGSLYAMKRNWRAFVAYGLVWMGVYFVVVNAAALLIVALAGQQQLGLWLMPVGMILMSALAASAYASYHSIFAEEADHEIR